MRAKLDENLSVELAEELRLRGHDVDSVVEERLGGASEDRVLLATRRARRVLITLDKGIGDVRRHPPSRHGGVVLLRCQSRGPGCVRGAPLGALPQIVRLAGPGRLVVVTETTVRVRR